MLVVKELENQKWIELLLKNESTDIFVVGGWVRDKLLGVKSNDIDLLVTGLTHKEIEAIISPFGKLTETDGHFKTIKYKPFGWSSDLDDIDIVIPRVDVKMTEEEFKLSGMNNNHHAFKIESNPNMSPIEDLKRRDLTINSIGINIVTGEMLDPFNGQQDLKDGVIRMTNEKTFVDDPVRMLRALRFAHRFDFVIEEETSKAIKKHASSITTMSEERFLSEIKKVYKSRKRNLNSFYENFIKYDFHNHLFNPIRMHGFSYVLNQRHIKFAEFVFALMGKQKDSKNVFLTKLKGDIKLAKQIEALQFGIDNYGDFEDVNNYRHIAFSLFKISKDMFNSYFFNLSINTALNELRSEKFTNLNDLDINGQEIMNLLGIDKTNIKQRGKEIGLVQHELVVLILNKELVNKNKNITAFIKNKFTKNSFLFGR